MHSTPNHLRPYQHVHVPHLTNSRDTRTTGQHGNNLAAHLNEGTHTHPHMSSLLLTMRCRIRCLFLPNMRHAGSNMPRLRFCFCAEGAVRTEAAVSRRRVVGSIDRRRHAPAPGTSNMPATTHLFRYAGKGSYPAFSYRSINMALQFCFLEISVKK
jgi:hypothetical protein